MWIIILTGKYSLYLLSIPYFSTYRAHFLIVLTEYKLSTLTATQIWTQSFRFSVKGSPGKKYVFSR